MFLRFWRCYIYDKSPPPFVWTLLHSSWAALKLMDLERLDTSVIVSDQPVVNEYFSLGLE